MNDKESSEADPGIQLRVAGPGLERGGVRQEWLVSRAGGCMGCDISDKYRADEQPQSATGVTVRGGGGLRGYGRV